MSSEMAWYRRGANVKASPGKMGPLQKWKIHKRTVKVWRTDSRTKWTHLLIDWWLEFSYGGTPLCSCPWFFFFFFLLLVVLFSWSVTSCFLFVCLHQDVEKERELRTEFSREEIRQKIELYNSVTKDHLKMTLVSKARKLAESLDLVCLAWSLFLLLKTDESCTKPSFIYSGSCSISVYFTLPLCNVC